MIGIFVLTAVLGTSSQVAHVRIVSGSARSKPIHLVEDGRQISLEAREVQLSISFPSGKTGAANVLMLYEPRNRFFWWTYENGQGVSPGGITDRFFSQSMIYVTEAKIVGFTGGAFLEVRELAERRANMEDGQSSVLATIENSRGEIEGGELRGYLHVNLAKSLPSDFVHLRGNAAPLPLPKLREVSMRNGKWQVVLDGPNGDSAVVLLDDNYNVVSAKTQPPTQFVGP
jgi:hypothetical protein